MEDTKDKIYYLFDIFKDRQNNMNLYSCIYFILLISMIDNIGDIGIKLYVSLILSQLITWGSMFEKEHRYKMMKSFYKKLNFTEGSEKKIHKNSCKVLASNKNIAESVLYGTFYSFPLIYSFLIIGAFLSVLGITGYMLFALMVVEIVSVIFTLVDWSVMSKEVIK